MSRGGPGTRDPNFRTMVPCAAALIDHELSFEANTLVHLRSYRLVFGRECPHGPNLGRVTRVSRISDYVEGKANPVTGRGGPDGLGTSRLPLCYKLGPEMAVSLIALSAGRPHFFTRKIPGTHFC
jgi:hypothetical protein